MCKTNHNLYFENWIATYSAIILSPQKHSQKSDTGKKKRKKRNKKEEQEKQPTTPAVPRWSPIQVLSGPDTA